MGYDAFSYFSSYLFYSLCFNGQQIYKHKKLYQPFYHFQSIRYRLLFKQASIKNNNSILLPYLYVFGGEMRLFEAFSIESEPAQLRLESTAYKSDKRTLDVKKRRGENRNNYALNDGIIINGDINIQQVGDKLEKKTNKMANNYDFLFKFIIIGDSSVGKSCMLLRFTQNRFKQDHEPTLGVEFGSRNAVINDLTIKIQIWDTTMQAGQQSFKAITRSYYKGSIAAFLVYDVTKRDSFDNISRWLYEVKNHSHEKVEIVLVGNKIDMKDKRQVSYQQGQKFANNNGFMFFETSAQTGEKIQEMFKSVAKKIVGKIQSKEINPDSESSYGLRRGKKQTKRDPNKPQPLTPTPVDASKKDPNKKCCSN